MDNSILSPRFVTPAYGTEVVNAKDGAKEATASAMQLLRSVALEEKLQNAVSALKKSALSRTDASDFEAEFVKVPSGAEGVDAPLAIDLRFEEHMIHREIAHFWDDMVDDAMMRYGRAEVEHIHTRDLAYLENKVRDLELKISKMPASFEKESAASTLQRFADEQKQQIDGAYQSGLNRVAKSEVPRTPRVPLGLMETVEALTDELQRASQSPIQGSGGINAITLRGL